MLTVPVPPSLVLLPDGWRDYELLDSGGGRKLERYGQLRVVRPEPQAMWRPRLAEGAWQADAVFEPTAEEGGHWHCPRPLPSSWELGYGSLRFAARLTPFRHLGFFPEQACHWDWAAARIAAAGSPLRVLNAFAYTGLASLACAQAGAEVTHLDASPKAIEWAKENQRLAGLGEHSIRWICEDALAFLRREVRRGKTYHGILLDPPKFGRGDKGQVFKLFTALPELLELAAALLDAQASFLVLTSYALRVSPLALRYAVAEALAARGRGGGDLAHGELGIAESHGERVLPAALFVRWSAQG